MAIPTINLTKDFLHREHTSRARKHICTGDGTQGLGFGYVPVLPRSGSQPTKLDIPKMLYKQQLPKLIDCVELLYDIYELGNGSGIRLATVRKASMLHLPD